MRPTRLRVSFSFSPADDRPPIGNEARFGFVSLLRLNLAQSLARRGVSIEAVMPGHAGSPSPQAAPDETADFGALLRAYRIGANLSQEALAERARISVNGLSALERGVRRTPQRETLGLLVDALGLRSDERTAFEAAARKESRSPQTPPGDTRQPGSAAIEEHEVTIVVMSPAWSDDPSRRNDMARIGADRREAGRRVVVVRREPFEAPAEYEWLRDTPHFDFFRESPQTHAFERLYRNDGKPVAAFYDTVDLLAEAIYRFEIAPEPASLAVPSDGRTVYVSLPAADMEAQYRTLVTELKADGYTVVPSPSTTPTRAMDAIDRDLGSSIASIHLVGDDERIDDAGRSFISYPLSRAAAEAGRRTGFARIVFAPKMLENDRGVPSEPRDPIEVRDRFAAALSSDTVVGDGITDFVLAAKELIARIRRRSEPVPEPAPLAPGSAVFVNFHPGDVSYARSIAKAFREHGYRARFAAFEDDKVQNKITNTALVRESHVVVHCWANATDAWLYAEAADYDDWRKFGRSGPFHVRAAIAGPPERNSKLLYTASEPPEAIDVYVDLTARETPNASDLMPIVSVAGEAERP